MKKITMMLIVMMMLSLTTSNVFAVNVTFNKDGLTYTLIDDKSVSVTAADLTQNEYHIPATITNDGVEYTVISLGENLFENAELSKITLPDTLKYIESNAFKKCKRLTSIELPDDIQVIEMNTFEGCSNLKSIQLPKHLKVIKADAFRGCGLESIHIPDSVTRIHNNVFIHCRSLVSAVISKNLEYLGASSFWYCDRLEQITLSNRIQTIEANAFEESPRFSKIMVITGSTDEPINQQILAAISNADNPPQIYRGVTDIQANHETITALSNSQMNLDSYFTTSFDVYDESGQPSAVMTIPQSYQNTEYQLLGQHSENTHIIGNQLVIGSDEKDQIQIQANLNGYTQVMTINIEKVEIISIEIAKMPNQTTYKEGQSFDPTGLKLKLNDNHGNNRIVEYNDESKDEFDFSISRPLKITDKNILIYFAGQSIELPIKVLNQPVINDVPNHDSPNHELADKDSLKEQSQNQTPSTSDETSIIRFSLLILLSTATLSIRMKRKKD